MFLIDLHVCWTFSGDVTGTGLVTIYEGLTRELSTQHQFSHLVGNSCTDVTIQFYDRQLLIYQGPTIQLYFARPSCELFFLYNVLLAISCYQYH